MNREWLLANFLKNESEQSRAGIPDPSSLFQLLANFTSKRFANATEVRRWLQQPQHYDRFNFYDDTEERFSSLLHGPPCAYCTEVPIAPLQGLHCTHRTSICTACLKIYFEKYKFTRQCGRKFVDGTYCTETINFRVEQLDARKTVHKFPDACEHGFVFRFAERETLEFKCFFPGCTKFCTLVTMYPPPTLELEDPVELD